MDETPAEAPYRPATGTAYIIDPTSMLLLCALVVQESPLEPGVWLLPPNATMDPPPHHAADEVPMRDGDAWLIVPRVGL